MATEKRISQYNTSRSETALYAACSTFIAGFCNTYSFRHFGAVASFHSGSLMQLGISLGEADILTALRYFWTVIVFLSEIIVYGIAENILKIWDKDILITGILFCTIYTFLLLKCYFNFFIRC